jgi:hypothetical protein
MITDLRSSSHRGARSPSTPSPGVRGTAPPCVCGRIVAVSSPLSEIPCDSVATQRCGRARVGPTS